MQSAERFALLRIAEPVTHRAQGLARLAHGFAHLLEVQVAIHVLPGFEVTLDLRRIDEQLLPVQRLAPLCSEADFAHLVVAATVAQEQRFANVEIVQLAACLDLRGARIRPRERLAIDADDQVAALQAGPAGGTLRGHRIDARAGIIR